MKTTLLGGVSLPPFQTPDRLPEYERASFLGMKSTSVYHTIPFEILILGIEIPNEINFV